MKQIYKNLYKDDEGRYVFASETDTRYVADQQSYILIYILEMLLNKDKEIVLTPAEKVNGEA